MKIPHNQLSLFDAVPTDYNQTATDKAYSLLDLLNMDRKPKDQYELLDYFREGIYIILLASNKGKDIVCNIIDIYGNVPKDFSVNWRNFQHIAQDLNLNITTS